MDDTSPTPHAAAPAPGPLGALVAALPPRGEGIDADLRAYFERTWSRLAAGQRLAQSQAAVPDKAGPLNSELLVYRSLALMRELSPAYLERFLAQAEALGALERWHHAQSAPPAPAPRGTAKPASRRAPKQP